VVRRRGLCRESACGEHRYDHRQGHQYGPGGLSNASTVRVCRIHSWL
jgi:hypothetical protein